MVSDSLTLHVNTFVKLLIFCKWLKSHCVYYSMGTQNNALVKSAYTGVGIFIYGSKAPYCISMWYQHNAFVKVFVWGMGCGIVVMAPKKVFVNNIGF